MELHSKGKQDYQKQLEEQKRKEIKEVLDRKGPAKEKVNVIQRIIKKFNELVNESDQSLFIIPA